MFILANVIVSFGVGIVDALINGHTILSNLYSLAMLLPGLAAAVRRMHDSDRSGWWVLLPFVNLVFCCLEGTRGANRFGNDPKQPLK